MNGEIVKEWKTKSGYNAKIVKCDPGIDIPMLERCWYNGYVEVPQNHSLFGKPYSDIDTLIEVHGGLTYSGNLFNAFAETNEKENKTWWFGYDCHHYQDNITSCDLDYNIEQCEDLAKQLLNFIPNKTKYIFLVGVIVGLILILYICFKFMVI